MLDHCPVDANIGNDLAGDGEFGLAQVAGQHLGDAGGAGTGDAQVDAVALAGERQRSPVGRAEVAKQNPIAIDSGSTEQSAQRLAIHPVSRRVTVQSDNPAYPDWPDCGLDEIHCIGRVIWAGRKIA